MKTGKLPENILKLSVLGQLHTRNDQVISGAAVGTDCAFLKSLQDQLNVVCSAEAELAMETQTSMDGGAGFSMTQLVQIFVNRLAAGGARPVAAFFTLFLPEETEKEWIRLSMAEAEKVCSQYRTEIAGVQCRVIKGIRLPAAAVNGYGTACMDQKRTAGDAKPFQDIVLSKWAGILGTMILAARHRDELREHYRPCLITSVEKFQDFCSVVKEANIALSRGAGALYAASEGGIFGALWELAEEAGVGFDIDLRKIPLRQETVEICEYLGVNPYELHSEGCLVMTADNGEELAEALRAEGIEAVVIGRTTDKKAKIIRNDEEVRYMDRPKQDEIFRSSL